MTWIQFKPKNGQRWAVRQEDQMSRSAVAAPLWLFINTDTGELRSFAVGIAEEKGEDYYLRGLNDGTI